MGIGKRRSSKDFNRTKHLPIDMQHIDDEPSDVTISILYNAVETTFLVLSNGHIYGWGGFERFFMTGGVFDPVPFPIHVPFDKYVSNIQDVLSISCYTSCVALISQKNGKDLAVTWGIEDNALLGRQVTGDGWKYPKPINMTNIGNEENIVSVGTGRWNHGLITDAGNYYVWGSNLLYDLETYVPEWDQSLVPIRVLRDPKVAVVKIPINHYSFMSLIANERK